MNLVRPALWAAVLGACAAAQAQDEAPSLPPARKVERPLWELGLGVGGLTLPDYRGAADRTHYVLPIPYVVYRGEWLRADRDGARAVLLEARRTEIDLSVNASPPARSDSRGPRAGMDDLPATVELGPNLNYTLWRTASGRARLDLRLPLRAVMTLERSPRYVGSVFAPHLNLDLAELAGGWRLGLQGGPLFATRRYHHHFYGVDASDVQPGRPAYRADAGYGGWQALAAVSRRFERTWVGAFIRYDHVGGAAFADSPLVERRQGVAAGIAVSWVLATSERRVLVEE
jgi:outer membrane protein